VIGTAGIERALDERLTNPATIAQPVTLSIDTRVQAAMESELGRAMTTFSANPAMPNILF
jgi:cell division protein FtsI (penicillin-binding protein 3)